MSPLVLNRREAAEYVGVSPTTFDKLVAKGHMPKARQVPGINRVVWLRTELEDTVHEFQTVAANPWEGFKL